MPKFHFELEGVRFCLDPDLRSLMRDDAPIEDLQWKTFSLLELLVTEGSARPGVPVSHKYLLNKLWPEIANPTVRDHTLIAQQRVAIHKKVKAGLIGSKRNTGYFVVPHVRTEPAHVERVSQPVRPVHESVVALDVKDLPSFLKLDSPRAFIGFRHQGVKAIDLSLGERILGSLKCTIKTGSPYFRFGLKLLERTGRLLGDAVIVTADNSCVLHIGRNSAPREFPRITERDVFLTIYKGVEQVGDGVDRRLFETSPNFSATVELRVEHGETHPGLRTVSLRITHLGRSYEYYREELDCSLLSRVAILTWADGNGCLVEVSDLSCS